MNVFRISIMSQWAGNSAIAVLLIAGGTVIGQRAVLRADDQNGEKPAAKSTGGAKNSLDEELLKGLSNDLLEGIDDLPKLKPEEKPAATNKAVRRFGQADGKQGSREWSADDRW